MNVKAMVAKKLPSLGLSPVSRGESNCIAMFQKESGEGITALCGERFDTTQAPLPS
jgi:hypothetical protein